MLMWDKPENIEGLTVYRDHADGALYYILPSLPRFRIDDNGQPVFKFIKYRYPVDREDGKKGGGFLIADVEFVVPEDKLQKTVEKLQERLNLEWQNGGRQPPAPQVQIGQLSFLRGAASITVLDSGGSLVENIRNPGAPSLYGKMITPFTVELSAEGATLMEQALQDKGGIVQVAYDIWLPVRLPPVTASVWFNAEKYMSFHQEIDVEERFWSEDDYRETIRETFTQRDAGGVSIDPGGVTDPKVIGAVRDWAWRSLEEGVAKMILGDIPPEKRDADSWYKEEDFENISRDVVASRVASFSRTYTENAVMEWNPGPRGTLPNITSMKSPDGQPYKWEDYALVVDLNDPFFKQLRVTARANADFDKLPLDSVEVKIEYKQGAEHSVKEFSLRNANDLGKFAAYIAGDSYRYKYSYQVNYKNASKSFQSEELETDEEHLTINVGDTGILLVNVAPGDLNFSRVTEALVTLRYEDRDNGVDPLEQVFKLDKEHPEHQWAQVIYKPRKNPYRYRVKYFMADGKKFESDERSGSSAKLFIDDPFSASRTVNVRAFGDFAGRIDAIFVDLRYADEANGYSQNQSVVLNKENLFYDWTFPVVSETGGKLTYSANIRFMDGSVQEIPETVAERGTIMLGDVVFTQAVDVLPDLIDFNAVKLVKVTLRYRDELNGIDESSDLVFKKDVAKLIFSFPYKDKTKTSYEWSASYYMADGSVKSIPAKTTTEKALVLPEKAD